MAVKPTGIVSPDELKQYFTPVFQDGSGQPLHVGSALLTGDWESVLTKTEEYPAELFKELDVQWQAYARDVAQTDAVFWFHRFFRLCSLDVQGAMQSCACSLPCPMSGQVWNTLDAIRETHTL